MKASMTIRTEFAILFSDAELALLKEQSKRHYDGLCKAQSTDPTGMIARALRQAEENKGDAYFIQEYEDHAVTVYWTTSHVDLACKILEFPMYQDKAKNTEVHALRHKLARVFRAGKEAFTEFGVRQIELP